MTPAQEALLARAKAGPVTAANEDQRTVKALVAKHLAVVTGDGILCHDTQAVPLMPAGHFASAFSAVRESGPLTFTDTPATFCRRKMDDAIAKAMRGFGDPDSSMQVAANYAIVLQALK